MNLNLQVSNFFSNVTGVAIDWLVNLIVVMTYIYIPSHCVHGLPWQPPTHYRVADNSSVNKMSLNNLSTVYGPNLLSPGGNEMQMDVVTPVSVVLFFLNCPAEYFDETLFGRSDLSTSTSSSNKSRNTGGRGSYTPSSEQRDSSINISVTPLPLKRVPTDELDAPLGSSPSRGINRRSRRSSNKLLVATKSETKTPIPSGKESLV